MGKVKQVKQVPPNRSDLDALVPSPGVESAQAAMKPKSAKVGGA